MTDTPDLLTTGTVEAPSVAQDVVVRLPIGIHQDVPEHIYHADPAVHPSASASILKTLHDQSPLHAQWDHPRLNPKYEATEVTEMQRAGTILHSMILGTPVPYAIVPFDNYKKAAAQEARDAAIATGKIPILPHKLEEHRGVADALRNSIAQMGDVWRAIEAATFETTLIWVERGSLCRCRIDILPPARFGFALDLKFTGRSAEPEKWGRTLVNEHLFQGALYPRGVKATRGDKPEFRFLVCEIDQPRATSLHAMDPQLEDLADDKVNHALFIWRECMATGRWPGYSPKVHYQEPPPWELARQRAREFRDSAEAPGETYARLQAAVSGGPVT